MILHALDSGLITVDQFPQTFFEHMREDKRDLAGIVREAEREAILDAMARAKGNKAAAARDLGLGRSTLGDKIARLELESEIERIIERS